MMYGYVRVSSKEQNPDRQMKSMLEYGINNANVFIDKQSGYDFKRPEYIRLLKTVRSGDVIVIKSIDRLGRNYREILEEWRIITKEKNTDIVVIDMPLLNTKTGTGDLTGKFISDLVLQILAYVAETERTFIRQRQAEGIAIAKAKGVRFGSKKKDIPFEFDQYYNLWIRGEISLRKAANELNISYSTFYRRCKERMIADRQNIYIRKNVSRGRHWKTIYF